MAMNKRINELVKDNMPNDELLYDVAELFKIFGDSTRIKIICALSQSEMCVCELSDILNMTQSAISHQLRILRQSRLVKVRRSGKSSFYSLDDDHIMNIFNLGLEHIKEG